MNISYLFKEALRTIGRNRQQFILSSAVQSICLLLLLLFGLITFNAFAVIRTAARRAEIYVFISDDAAANPLPLEQRIAQIAGVAELRFVSPEEALEELRRDLGPDTTLLAALGENPLPASIRIRLQPGYASAENILRTEQKLLLLPGVSEVESGKEILAQLNSALKAAILLNIIIFVIVAASVLFIVFQTIENAIINRSQEIEIMELVGASRGAIYTPFLIQGTLQGILGGISAFVMIFMIYRIVSSFIPATLFPAGPVLISTLLLGLLFGLGGSALALFRVPSTIFSSSSGAGS